MMNFSFEISVPALISGALGGLISYYLSKKLNKKTHQITLREKKYDEFSSAFNWLRDMYDIVIQDCRMQVINYDELGRKEEHRHMELFNKIHRQISKCSSLVYNYGKLFGVKNFNTYTATEIHSLALDLAMKMNYYCKNQEIENREFASILQKKEELEDKWDSFRPILLEISHCASKKRDKDLS